MESNDNSILGNGGQGSETGEEAYTRLLPILYPMPHQTIRTLIYLNILGKSMTRDHLPMIILNNYLLSYVIQAVRQSQHICQEHCASYTVDAFYAGLPFSVVLVVNVTLFYVPASDRLGT